MREQSTQGQEPAAQTIVHIWREYLRPNTITLAVAVLGGVIAALSSGFGIPAILQAVFSVIFDGEPLPIYAERIMLLFVRPEELPWLTVWENVVFGLSKKETDPGKIEAVIRTVGLSGFEKAYPASGFQYEIEAIQECLEKGEKECPYFTLTDTEIIADWIETTRKEWGIVYKADSE